MTMKFAPYAEVMESGVPWIGTVPRHWSVVPNRALLKIAKDLVGSRSDDYVLLSLTKAGVIARDMVNPEGKFPASFDAYQVIEPGDLIFCLFDIDETPRTVGLSSLQGMITGAYTRFRCEDEITRKFIYLYYLAMDDQKSLKPLYTGLRKVITKSAFLSAKFPLPPLDEQRAIVRYLDHVDRRIRRYIRAKQKLIKLLEEQKQAIIHRAVTRGLDPNVRLKSAGLEWLGDVPAHWEIMALNRVTTSRCDGPFGSGLKSTHYAGSGIRVIRLQNIGHGEFNDSDAAYIAPDYYATLGDHSVEAGDIIIAGLGDDRHPAGRACVAPAHIVPAMVKADCFRFRLNPIRVNVNFVALHLTATANGASAVLSTGATRQRTNLQATAARKICVPPIEEQSAIVEHIEASVKPLNTAADRTNGEISLLREYRTRLIADIVTGKLDVREAAAHLPEELEEPRLLEDAASLLGDETESEELFDESSEETEL